MKKFQFKKRGGFLKHKTKLRKKSKLEFRKLKDQLWELCKKLTRRQFGNACYTCGYMPLEGSNWHTGHFIASSICSTELRYDLRNLRPQCRNCNFWRSGDWVVYEARLVSEHGEDYVKELKTRNIKTKGLKYDSLWYLDKIAEYATLLKAEPTTD